MAQIAPVGLLFLARLNPTYLWALPTDRKKNPRRLDCFQDSPAHELQFDHVAASGELKAGTLAADGLEV